jgi:hypothetical protein
VTSFDFFLFYSLLSFLSDFIIFVAKDLVAVPVMDLSEKKYLGIVSLVDIAVYIAYASYFHSKGPLPLFSSPNFLFFITYAPFQVI